MSSSRQTKTNLKQTSERKHEVGKSITHHQTTKEKEQNMEGISLRDLGSRRRDVFVTADASLCR